MTEAKHDVPSGHSALNTADVLSGSRPQKYVELLWTTDPLAEAVMDEFACLPEGEWRALLDFALAEQQSAWRESASCAAKIPAPSAATVQATIAYCDYVFRRYGKFPPYTAPFRTVFGFRVCRVDADFYDRFYEPGALPDSVRACTKQAILRPNLEMDGPRTGT